MFFLPAWLAGRDLHVLTRERHAHILKAYNSLFYFADFLPKKGLLSLRTFRRNKYRTSEMSAQNIFDLYSRY